MGEQEEDSLEKIKEYARREAEKDGFDCFVYQKKNGQYCVTVPRRFQSDEMPIGSYTPQGEWKDWPAKA